MSKIRVAIAEGLDLIRYGMIHLLKEESDIDVRFAFKDGQELLAKLEQFEADVIIIDLEMPTVRGREILQTVQQKFSSIRAIVLSLETNDEVLLDCISLGARGYLPKSCDKKQFVGAIRKVFDQGYFFEERLSKQFFQQLVYHHNQNPNNATDALTGREVEIVRLICDGMTNKEIANELHISIRTVEVHRKNISKKIQSANTAGIVIFAIKNGLYAI